MIKTTHIDTGGHGYLSVSKKDFLKVLIPTDISSYSGHNLTRVFLEEDCDATKFLDAAKAKGIEVEIKQGYNLRFKCTHNYKAELFNYQPKIDQLVYVGEVSYKVVKIDEHTKRMIVYNGVSTYKIPFKSIFSYVTKVTE